MVPQNIKINNVRSLDAKLVQDEYFDFMLYKGEAYGPASADDCLASYIDFSNPDCYTQDGGVQSLESWSGSVNDGIELEHIGMTGVDNGLISFDKEKISNELFYKLFFNSKLTIEPEDTKFHMTPVDGNTKQHCYDISIEEEDGKHYLAFKGGFLQGFYKTEGYNYQVLPDHIDSDWHMEFVIRPRTDYEQCDRSLNITYPENSGYFFYMGTRAENKFAEIMNRTDEFTCNYVPSFMGNELKSLRYYQFDDPDIYDEEDIDFFRKREVEAMKSDVVNGYYQFDDPDITDDEDIDFFSTAEHEELHDDMFLNDAAEKLEAYLNDMNLSGRCDPYLSEEDDMDLSGITVSAKTGYKEIETDNKFLFFNRTCTGFTVHTWDENIDKVILTGYTRGEYKTNAFLLFNRTCTGLTVHDVDKYFEDNQDDYDIQKDVIGNAFGLKCNADGSISYQYTMKDCDAEEGWSLQTESTLSGLVKDNVWNVINVRFAILNNSYRTCVSTDEYGNTIYKQVVNNVGSRKMKIMIYVNGYLVFISKELNEFRFRGLNDQKERQEGVPYNISLGGGTQGLGERIWIDYFQPIDCHYYLERTYAGTFIGDMRSFKFYECKLNYPTIKNNYTKEILL